ncbi:MAG: anaerobic ribonucleoside-triphosphate reductase [Veillonella parvula]|uniref:Anaerobic ribonucleoside-triphosphate reductase n=1 Tax=Veillonella parvula TaxID=29466 RepID=A0A943A4E2_VEIPA|nr:anaerobic ribonucleoside-triphosphate reductase [Veillonella parvula]MBS4894009.1 anaerobic ribonucleoside-triphosphate reductase [Veillonella parvula]
MREIKVIKKDGRVEGFDINKIFNAVSISASRVKKELSLENKKKLESLVHMELDNRINGDEGITVEELHFIVQLALNQIDKAIYVEYRNYKSYKTKLNMSFDNIYRRSKKLLFMSEEEKENANKNSALNSTQKSLLGSIMCKELLNYELTDEMKAARDDGGLYYHDEDDRIIMSHNCNIFNMANTLKDGFIMDGIKLKEASDFKTACRHVSNITINASSCQYGGFTIDIVTALAPFVQKTRNKFRKKYETFPLTNAFKEKQVELDTKEEVYESIKNLQYECNLIQNAQAQTTFLTWGLRLWGTEDEKLIVRATLETRMNKMGEDRIDFIFPKLSMASHRKLNDEKLFDLAVRCSAECLYPDWLSVESGYLGEVFERTGKIIYGMGCRAYLSPFINPDTGEEIYEGRANIGAISIMLPELAMRVKKGDIDSFLKEYDKYFEIALKTHEYFYEKIGKKKASSNPLFFCEGGCWTKLKPSDTCEKAVQGFTASFGYIGLHETSLILTGKPLHQNIEFGERIMKHMADKVEDAKKRTGHLYALYSSPSEGLCDKHRNFLYEKYGYIEGVTDKEWITNSFHIDVKTPISALEKIDIESKFFDYAKGGRIVYTEWSHTENIQALKDIITYAMRKGLYMGINFENGTCFDCKHQGDFSNTHVCPNCGSSNITVIDRVCGYLGFRKQNGKTRYNNGKDNETVERVKHYNIDAEEVI